MDNKKVVGGTILLAVAIWIFMVMPTTDPTARYLGGAILGVLGLALLIIGLKNT